MFRGLLRRSVLGFAAVAAVSSGNAAAQSFDPNIVNRVDSFIPTSPQTVLPTKTEKVPVKRTETVTVTVEEKKDLTTEEREALARKMGVVVPLGLRSTTARKAYLNLRKVPTYKTVKVKKQKQRVFTEFVEKSCRGKPPSTPSRPETSTTRPMPIRPTSTSLPIPSTARTAIC